MVDINKVDITPCTFLDHDAMKLEVESKKKYWTYQKYVEIMNIQIENEWSIRKLKRKFETNENENMFLQTSGL